MNGFGGGARRFLREAVSAVILVMILGAFFSTGLIPPIYQSLFQLVLLLGTIGMLLAMMFWSTWYIIGYIVMGLLLFNSGIADPLEILIFVVAGILVLLHRFGILDMIFGGNNSRY